MNFISPSLLWGLVALIPLTAIYLLKVRPRRKLTNTYFLWEKILEEKTASALFRRFRDLFSWLFLLVATVFIILSLANPKLNTDDNRELVLVLDNSPSMGAQEGQQTVLELAKTEAKSIITALDGSRRAAIAELSEQLRFASHLSDSPKDLLDAVENISLSPLSTLPLAVEQVNRLAAKENARVILLTDGNRGFDKLSEKVEVLTLGHSNNNVGITSADLAWIPGQTNTASLFYQIASSFPEKKLTELILRNNTDGSILRVIPLNLQPGLNEAQSITIENITPGSWIASLELSDALTTDNTVTFGLNPPRRIQVEVISNEPYFFQRSVESFERVGSLLQQVNKQGEIVVSDQSNPSGRKLVLFNPEGNDSPWWQNLSEQIEVLAPEFLIEDHPILKHLELESLTFAGARRLTAPESSLVLVESQDGIPLIYKALDENGRQAVIFNLDPAAEDFVLSPWFPVLIYESARDLTGEQSQLNSIYPLGSRVQFPAPENMKPQWRKPNGKIIHQNEGLILDPGFHQISTADQDRIFGASLLASTESLLDQQGPTNSQKALSKGRLLAWWLLLVALSLIVLESILYHRRKLG